LAEQTIAVAEARELLDQWQIGVGLRHPENWDLSSYSTNMTCKKNSDLRIICSI